MRVIKLGGSLLDWPELPEALNGFIQSLPSGQPSLVMVGGGAIVDAVRSYDYLHDFPAQETHWCCVELMETTASLLHLLFPQWQRLSNPPVLRQWLAGVSSADHEASRTECGESVSTQPPLAIISPAAFYGRDLDEDALPANWDTTSDSVAALLAGKLGARELILLKSAGSDVEIGSSDRQTWLRSLADATLVDPNFCTALPPGTKLRLVNLRNTFG